MAGGDPVASALAAIDAGSVVDRVWARDHTLWDPDPAGIEDRLGWLDADERIGPRLGELERLADEAAGEGGRTFVLAGMGGSSAAAKAIAATLGAARGRPRMVAADSTVPAEFGSVLRTFDPARSLVVVASKSGTTAETLALYRALRDAADDALGPARAGQRFVAITDPGTPLSDLAHREGFRRTFLSEPTLGGRFSAMTHYGLLPAALMGAGAASLVESGTRMRAECAPGGGAVQNPAAVLGAAIAAHASGGRDKLTLVTSPGLSGFAPWAVHLVAESLGKRGRGVVPVSGEPEAPLECYGPDRLFVHLRLEGDDNAGADAFIRAVAGAGHPVVTLPLADRGALGGEFFRWEMAVAIAAALVGVNPFDQPDVERSKDHARSILRTPGARASRPEDGADELLALLADSRRTDYLAVLAFLPRTAPVEVALSRLREAVLRRWSIATSLDYGPGYMHSTGQLHKGGGASGIFTVLTAPQGGSRPAPSAFAGLGRLTDATALGDLAALRDLGRRAVHIGLGEHPAASIESLAYRVGCDQSIQEPDDAPRVANRA